MNRPALIKMIHLGRRCLGWDDETYRGWMQEQVGKHSSTECTDRELSHLVTYLQSLGVVDKKSEQLPASAGRQSRPTKKQWEYALDLSKKVGMTGTMDDPALVTLCRKVAKKDHPRFLDQKGIGNLINALQGWKKNREKHEQEPG
ncbi:MAG: DUF1018 domain-containing protein [Dechloromonas sp.]|jgi:phage gp16-like protein|nr:DUF1018 domain-containing protein [Dechloromonas sp.]